MILIQKILYIANNRMYLKYNIYVTITKRLVLSRESLKEYVTTYFELLLKLDWISG